MRITTNMQNQNIMSSMLSNQSDIAKLQTQLATGNKVNSASDSPSSIPAIMDANTVLNKIDIYKNNITYLNGEIEVAEGTLGQVTEYIQRLKDLTLEAANGTNSSEQLKLINDEVKQIKEQIVSLANTKYQDSYIFSGNRTGTTAYTINDDGSIVYNGTPSTADYSREYSIADNVNVSINVAGDSAFGYSNLKSAGPPAVYEGQGLLHIVNGLTMLLEENTPNYDAIRSQLDGLDEAQNTILAARTELGGAQSRLNMTEEQHENSKITYKSIQANLQEIDVAQIVTDLSTKQVALQASLYAGSQVMNISIMDYL